MSGNVDYREKGATFGKIVIGILLFVILIIYVYHHSDNGITFPQ